MQILDKIKLPEDLKKLSLEELELLASDLRNVITKYTLANGGHLASNLGVVDLTCALNYVFDFPKDKLIFDVGHQCYAYKILTGRLKEFDTLRQKDGLNGFPKREESRYDTVNSGHASTALSIACGMARGNVDGDIICLIGDGAMTGGLFFEALNDALTLDKKIIFIINDNNMSISDNVGFINEYLKIVRKYGNEFTFLDMEMLNNIDGHNISDLIGKLRYAKNAKKTLVLHVVTKKGKGFEDAELNPSKYHSVGKPNSKPTYCQVFGDTMTSLADKNDNVFAITAAMTDGTGLSAFAEKYPQRLVDVGIAEGHAVTMSAGLALAGKKPYVAIYSTFLQRAYDNVLHDVCLNKLPVVFCIDRAGFVGGDGETHQGLYDVAYLGAMPNMSLFAPKDGEELKSVLSWSQEFDCPLAIRYPKSEISCDYTVHTPIEYGKWEWIKFSGSQVVLISNGETLADVCQSAEILKAQGVDVDIVNARFIRPYDEQLLDSLKGRTVFFFEEYIAQNSLYAQALEKFNKDQDDSTHVYGINIPNVTYPVATRSQLLKEVGLDRDSIVEFVKSKLN
ncbi:MAG: 1-deoxy-D-xylulose-5-phosphate synthase [Clostridia bacterium]|nr:1-deoxy-D-xylulose-5-phosphate synthase [Clostridia bacterium]